MLRISQKTDDESDYKQTITYSSAEEAKEFATIGRAILGIKADIDIGGRNVSYGNISEEEWREFEEAGESYWNYYHGNGSVC